MTRIAQRSNIVLNHQTILWTDGLVCDGFVQTSQRFRLVFHSIESDRIEVEFHPFIISNILQGDADFRFFHQHLFGNLLGIGFSEDGDRNLPLQILVISAAITDETLLLDFQDTILAGLFFCDN